MNDIRINLNEAVKVKLTDLGKDIYYHQFDELNHNDAGESFVSLHFQKKMQKDIQSFNCGVL